MVSCPICGKSVRESHINQHLDSNCTLGVELDPPPSTAPIFKTPAPKREAFFASSQPFSTAPETPTNPKKRPLKLVAEKQDEATPQQNGTNQDTVQPVVKKSKSNAFERAAPLAERMRPKSLDEVCGQDLVGPDGVLRGLIQSDRVPSMILWGHAGTGKTTIARLIASQANTRFVEINSTSSGVAECKKIFAEAKSELTLTGRKTIIFCDEIHRFSKSQQDVFLAPVEAGLVTLIGATTENPSFKVQNALLSRCRTFTLSKLSDADVTTILERALTQSKDTYHPDTTLVNNDLISYLASFSDGDARTALNLLELAMDLSTRPSMTLDSLKSSLTKTLVYDRAGDQHYDTISALHKSVRGSNPDAALYYLARMIQSGEDALYIARRMVVMASEDIGLADNTMLSLATATYSACEKIGLPECRINLAHCAVALSLAPKSTRAYRGLNNAMSALQEPGIAGLSIPIHLRNAPTRLMKEIGYGKEYKYNPKYVDGRVKQDYLPEKVLGKTFLEDRDLGTEIDTDLEDEIAENGVEEDEETLVKAEPAEEKGIENGESERYVEYKDHGNVIADVVAQEEKSPPEQGGEYETGDDEDPALPLSSQTEPPAEWQ
ncbi:DNA-dependent ATPase mgs1 [Exophiala xenobiotica]|uniref:DNA-dependent ATPase mgs1 n=1 Tax=Lithohypha guttulata TaxID=1690604 RepID=A0ABR0KCN3_9EURO|nr:DNA-dependent ATPase mgs1 [Lithohypha guttulata]KAK5319850.1 DNA-dependent ATPase mgs1 [Exophiala xenobiotica]